MICDVGFVHAVMCVCVSWCRRRQQRVNGGQGCNRHRLPCALCTTLWASFERSLRGIVAAAVLVRPSVLASQALASGCPQLMEVSLFFCRYITDAGIQASDNPVCARVGHA